MEQTNHYLGLGILINCVTEWRDITRKFEWLKLPDENIAEDFLIIEEECENGN